MIAELPVTYTRAFAFINVVFMRMLEFSCSERLCTVHLRQSYVSKFKFDNAEMSQLWQTFEHATGNRYRIADVMDTWTRQMGFPVVTVHHVTGNEYLLNQTRFLINPDDQYDATDSPYG